MTRWFIKIFCQSSANLLRTSLFAKNTIQLANEIELSSSFLLTMDSTPTSAILRATRVQNIIQHAVGLLTAWIDHRCAQMMIALGQLFPVTKQSQPPSESANEGYHRIHDRDAAPQVTADSEEKQSTENSTLVQNPLRTLFDELEGQQIKIPSVFSLCPTWHVSKNPNLDAIRDEFGAWVNQYDSSLCKKTSLSSSVKTLAS